MSKDFGITEDEAIHNKMGKTVYAYFNGTSNQAKKSPYDSQGKLVFENEEGDKNGNDLTSVDNIFGSFFDLVCTATSKWFHISEGEYEWRHRVNAFFGFIGILFAGLFAKRIAGWRAGVIALLLLALAPRYIGHSMNNPKDIPFAAFYMMDIYFLLKFMEELPRPKTSTLLFLSLGIAFSIDIRIAGILIIAYLLAFFFIRESELLYHASDRKGHLKKLVRPTLYVLFVCLVGYFGAALLWPYDRTNPLTVPMVTLSKLSGGPPFNSYCLFEGKWWNSWEIPWYYVPKWYLITMPLCMLTGLILSPLLFINQISVSGKNFNRKKLVALIFFTAFPIAYTIAIKTNEYDDMRHLLFCYPPMAAFAAISTDNFFRSKFRKYIKFIAVIILICFAIEPLKWMIKNHPNEFVYFSPMIGGVDGAFKKYETDFWGNSDRAAVEWIQNNIKPQSIDKPIRIKKWYGSAVPAQYYVYKKPGYIYVFAVDESADWDYSIVTTVSCKFFNNVLFNWPPPGTVHEIKADSTPLLAIVKNPCIEHPEIMVQYLEKSLQANPTPQGYVNLGLMYINQGKYIEGIAANKKAISLNPNNLIAYNNLGSAYGGLFMWNEEIEALHKALTIDSSFALAKNNLNYAQSMLTNNTVKMTAGVYLNQSLEYYNEGKYENCISACRKCLELDSVSSIAATAWNNMCSSYNALGKFAEAQEACSHALKITPGFTLAQNNLNYAREHLKKE